MIFGHPVRANALLTVMQPSQTLMQRPIGSLVLLCLLLSFRHLPNSPFSLFQSLDNQREITREGELDGFLISQMGEELRDRRFGWKGSFRCGEDVFACPNYRYEGQLEPSDMPTDVRAALTDCSSFRHRPKDLLRAHRNPNPHRPRSRSSSFVVTA